MINETLLKNIPEELKSLPQWVGFLRTSEKNGRMSKKPVNPHTLYGASSTNSETWGSFEDALSSIGKPCKVGMDSGKVEGIGFVFAPPYCGIDLDHVIDPDTGEIQQDALDVVETVDSYTEISPSGTGLHIIYKGAIHPDWKKKQGGAFGENTDLEMYQTGRYFTVTGNIFGNYTAVNERDSMAQLIQNTYMKQEPKAQSSKPKVNKTVVTKSDNDIIETAMNSKSGMLFSELYSGNWQGKYASQSEADMAFCSMLAFWFGRDVNRMDAVFRRSGLMREKWDRPWDCSQSGSTYGKITLQKAVDGCREIYSPEASKESNFSISVKKSKPSKVYSLDDTGNAERIADMFGEIIGYNYVDRSWMMYSDGKWSYDQTGHISRLVDKSMEVMTMEKQFYIQQDEKNGDNDKTLEKAFEKHLKRSRSSSAKTSAEKESRHRVPLTPAYFDKEKFLLNTPDGVINLDNFSLRKSTPKDYFTKMTAAHYDEKAVCPLWEKFLDEIFQGDSEMIRYIQKAVGYSLTGSTQEQCAFFLLGDGCNGKSTFIDVIRCMFGDYARNIQAETLMIRNNTGINSDIARLKGARLVTSAEPNEGVKLNEGLLKQLTGGDIVTARRLYGDEFEYKPEFKIWMAANHKPTIHGTDHGIWRRIHIIPFNVKIPKDKVDKTLTDKLMDEIDGIFQWALQGLKFYQQEGLALPSVVADAVSEYKKEMDVVSRFLESCTVKSFTMEVKAGSLYKAYSEWCRDNGEYQMSNTKFGKEMCQKFERVKKSDGWYYSGLECSGEYKGYNITVK